MKNAVVRTSEFPLER